MKNLKSLIANPEDFIPKGEYNPHNIHAFLICNEYGLLCIAYASHLQDALDIAVDANMLDSMLLTGEDLEDYQEHSEPAYLGNAGEPFDIDYLNVTER